MTAPTTKPSALSSKLRARAKNIRGLLDKYSILRYGDEEWQKGDKVYRGGDKEKGKGPHQSGTPPKVRVVSSPTRIYYSEEEPAEEIEVANPLLIAMCHLNELTPEESKGILLQNRYSIITGLGVVERYDAGILLIWLRKLAKQITYILETREIYSEEIKAVYPELLNDLEIARSLCDQLSYTLGKQNGILNKKQFTEQVARLLHYAEVCQSSAMQLADYHDASIGGGEVSPMEDTVETIWVEEGKTPEEQEEEKRKEAGKGEEE